MLTQAELAAFINYVNNGEITEEETTQTFNVINTNDDNVIDVNELAASFEGQERAERRERRG